ncbi:PAC2 family-domain-containing protein [Papiliotrema laurentii]|uniref:Proteasome assembly chaperone 2 n=1 Tax=Papiliotrema laurentii TaxID=5418 RepID=A0AAD9FTT8_PAPLA|nr:PAC2 family-domain-containing protein [Papiliotrema laurentii]
MAFYPVQGSSKDLLTGKTLVIPSVSLANLPQLAVDLLIHSLKLTRAGYIGLGDTVAPMIGASQDGLVTGGLEVYAKEGLDLVVIQQRSPVLKDKKDEHVELIKRFVEDIRPSFTLLLTSLDAANQDDQSLLTPHVSILPPSPSPTETSTPVHTNIRSVPSLPSFSNLRDTTATPYPPFIPGGGLSKRILIAFKSLESLPHGTIAAWCVEGDNRADAHALAALVLRLSEASQVEITEPREWEGLFGVVDGWSGGAGADAEIYG